MAGKGQAEGCASCAKWCLIVFNVIFCLIGIGLLATGIFAYVQLSDYLDIVGNPMVNAPAIVLIAFGCITFIIAAIGCIGACKESPCLLFTFAIVIGILLVAEIAAGIAAFVYRGQVRTWITDNGNKLMKSYNASGENAATDAWDTVQKKLECCGLNGRTDWTSSMNPNINGVPASCGTAVTGCLDAIVKILEDNIYIVGAVAVALGVIQLIGIVLACCVGCSARKGEMA